MKKYFWTTGLFSFVILLLFACNRLDELPKNHAIGKIIAITGQCYGEMVLIEVENPKGIGLPGLLPYDLKENKQTSVMLIVN